MSTIRLVWDYLDTALRERKWHLVAIYAGTLAAVCYYLHWLVPLSRGSAFSSVLQTVRERPRLLIFPVCLSGYFALVLAFLWAKVHGSIANKRLKALLWLIRATAVVLTLGGATAVVWLTCRIPAFGSSDGKVHILIARPYSPTGTSDASLEAWYQLWSVLKSTLPDRTGYDIRLLDREICDRPEAGSGEAERYARRANADYVIWGMIFGDKLSVSITPKAVKVGPPLTRTPTNSQMAIEELTYYAQSNEVMTGSIAVAARLAAAQVYLRKSSHANLAMARDVLDSAWDVGQNASRQERGLIRLYLAVCHLELAQEASDADQGLRLEEETLEHATAALRLLDRQSLRPRAFAYCLKGHYLVNKARRIGLSGGDPKTCFSCATQAFDEALRSSQCRPMTLQGMAMMSLALYDHKTQAGLSDEALHFLRDARSRLQEAQDLRPGFAAYNLACVSALLRQGDWRHWLQVARDAGTAPSHEWVARDPDLAWGRRQDPRWFREFLSSLRQEELKRSLREASLSS